MKQQLHKLEVYLCDVLGQLIYSYRLPDSCKSQGGQEVHAKQWQTRCWENT
jgi:hypothetical protein